MKQVLVLLCPCILAACVSLANAQDLIQGSLLQAAAVSIDISPIEPVALCGYANQALSTDTHDPLTARITMFRCNSEELLLVSTDLISFCTAYEGISEAICQALQIERRQLILSGNHNHSGPSLVWDEQGTSPNARYTRELTKKLIEAATQLRQKYQSISLECVEGSSPIGVNRRAFWPKGDAWPSGRSYIKILRNPEGIRDSELSLAIAFTQGGRPVASLWSFACHNRSFQSGRTSISADIFGYAARMAETRLGAPSASFAGASGDIDPWFTGGPKLNRDEEYKKMETAGAMLGWELIGLAHALQKPSSYVIPERTHQLASRQFELVLPLKGNTAANLANAEATTWSRISVAVIDELLIVVSDCELCTEIGLAIKKASPYKHVLIITNANGGRGYMPATHMYAEGGYEVDSSAFGVGSAELVVEAVLAQAWDFWHAAGNTTRIR